MLYSSLIRSLGFLGSSYWNLSNDECNFCVTCIRENPLLCVSTLYSPLA